MKEQSKSFLLAAAVLVVGIGLVVVGILSWPSDDEEVIAGKLAKLADVIAVTGEENPVMRMARLRNEFEEIFEEDVRVAIVEIGQSPRGRKQLAELGARGTVLYQSLTVSFTGQATTVDPATKTARTNATAKVTGSRGAGELRQDERDVRIDWSRASGDWLITDVTVRPKEQDD